jgi:hypothetical protein
LEYLIENHIPISDVTKAGMILPVMLKIEKLDPSPTKYKITKHNTMERKVKNIPQAVQIPGIDVSTCCECVL